MIKSSLLDKHQYNNYNTDKLQDNQSNNIVNSNKIKDLNIG